MLKKVKKNIFIALAAAAIIYLGLSIYADYNAVLESFKNFDWRFLPLLITLPFLNYFFRFLKWHYYLSIINIKISRKDSFAIFLSGLIMSVTPGKMGELLKSYLVKQVTGEPIGKTAPVIFAERITDMISLVLIGLVGAWLFDFGKEIVLGTGIFFLLIVVIISKKNFSMKIISLLLKVKFAGKYAEPIRNAYESSYNLLRPAPLYLMTLLSLVAWFFECLGLYIVLTVFDLGINLGYASFMYAFATIAGAITMLPGGLGVTEGSLTYLIIRVGGEKNLAVAATFLVRVVTLWFAVLVGAVSVFLYQKRFGEITMNQEKFQEK